MSNFIEQLKSMEDINNLIQQIIDNPENIKVLIDTVKNEKRAIKYNCEKVLRLASETCPELIYPYFDAFVTLMDIDNKFLKWGALLIIANLTAVDVNDKFASNFDKYFSLITGSEMVSANNIIGSSVKIADNKPELIDRIVNEILKVDKATYIHKGEVSPECKNVAYGEAIKAFDKLYDKAQNKQDILAFVRRQIGNTRAKVSKSAQIFIKKYS